MSGWEAALDDEEAGAVMRTVARQLKLWREAAGLTQPEFGAAIGYGEELVSSVERGRRIPRPEYLDAADCSGSRTEPRLRSARHLSAVG
jgi:DNA-binding transcriptional regulator YiaG